MKYLYNLDSSEEVGISLNLLPSVLKQMYVATYIMLEMLFLVCIYIHTSA